MSSGIRIAPVDLTDTEPGLSPLSAHLLYPPNRKLRAADCGRRFRFSSGATIGGVDTTSRGNSKSLANLLCAYAVPDDEPARIVRPRFQIPGPWTKFYYLNWPRKAWLLTPHVIAQI